MRFEPVAIVRSPVLDPVDHDWGSVESRIVFDLRYAPGLKGLEEFSHALVVCWLHEASFDVEEHLVRHPRDRADLPALGIFAQRARHRPNPLGVTAVRILSVDVEGGELAVLGLDAIDGSPVLDVKPYMPMFDCRAEATMPGWVDRLMHDYF